MADEDETTREEAPPAEKPKYDQAFFLTLAAQGKDAWNAWRRAHEGVRVTFAGVDFSDSPRDQIDFSGFEFGHEADFSGCKWRGVDWEYPPLTFRPGGVSFNGAIFGTGTRFISAAFGAGADLTGSAFGDYANFTGAVFDDFSRFTRAFFGSWANFTGAVFGDRADFTGVLFQDIADFRGATFGNHVSFIGVAFRGVARFAGAAFGSGILFSRADFSGEADFTGLSKEQWTATLGALFSRTQVEAFIALTQRHEESWKRCGSGPDRFLAIWFSGTCFNDEASFSDRSFHKRADFRDARFYYVPDIDWTGNFARFDFTGTEFGLARPGKLLRTAGTKLPSLLRAMRKAAEEARDHDFERDLYIAERKAELGIRLAQRSERLKKGPEELRKKLEDVDKEQREVWSNWRLQARARIAHELGIAVKIARLAVPAFWIVVMGLYRALADYGRSPVRPFVCWLILSLIIFPWLYGQILPVPQKASLLDADKYEQAVQMVARANAVPFIGSLTIDADIKKFLFCAGDIPDKCHPIPPKCYQWLVVFQNLVSITLVFFIGLALRNYFKIK